MEGTAIDFAGLISAVTGTVTPADVLGILGSCVGVGMTFFLMWLGARKILGSFQTSLTSGRLKV